MNWPLVDDPWLAGPLCQRLVIALLHFIWQGAVIAAVLAMVLNLFRPRSPATRYGLALGALLLMAACPPMTFWWCDASQPTEVVTITADQGIPVRVTSRGNSLVLDELQFFRGTNQRRWLAVWQPALMLVWLMGVGILGLRLTSAATFTWWLRRGRQPIAYELERRLMRLGRKLGVRTVGRVFASSKVQVATAVGFLRPIVLLPVAWLAELPPVAIEAIVAHELAHIRRWDLWATLVQRVVETLLFYHPAVWWVSRLVELERELCCDELAVAATGERLAYVQTLAAVARAPLAPTSLAVSITGERKMHLLQRVRHVLGTTAAPDRARWWPLGLVLAMLPIVMWVMAAGVPGGSNAALADTPREGGAREGGDRERGTRESPEGSAGRRESAERGKSDGDQDEFQSFKPKTVREAQLLKKIKSLEAEITALRAIAREGNTYTGITNFPEKTEKSPKRTLRDGDQPGKGPKDGEGSATKGPRDGEGSARSGAKDGEGTSKRGPKDGEGSSQRGPRDGDQPKEGSRDGDQPRRESRDG